MRRIWTVGLVVILIVLVGVAAYLFGKNQEKEAVQTEVVITPGSQVIIPSPEATQGAAMTPAESNMPVVVIESEGNIPPLDLSEIKARIINPYIDYQRDAQPGSLVSFKVSPNLLESKTTYPYMADAVFKNGGNEGFLISKNNGHIDWFIPACLNGCVFSETFKAKYPEIIKLTQ